MTRVLNLLPLTLLLLMILLLTACEETQVSGRSAVQNAQSSSSSDSATTADNSARLKAALDSFRKEKEALCPQNHPLLKFLGDAFRRIRFDPSLSEDQKRQRAQMVFDRNRAVIDSEYARMEACIAANEEAWQAIEEKEGPVVSACLVDPPADKRPFEDARAPFRRPPPPPPPPDDSKIPADRKAEIQAKRNGSACTAELDKLI